MCENLPGAGMSTKRNIYIAVLAQSLKGTCVVVTYRWARKHMRI